MSAPGDKDIATQAKELAETRAYVTQLQQENTARLGRLSDPALERANSKLRELLHLMEKPVAILTHPDVVNAMQGLLNNPDPRQRSYFEAFAARFENVPFQDIMPILALLQRAKRRRGRRKGSTIRSDADLLRKMKILIGQGMSVSKAALQFADQARIGGTRRSTAKRLERKYLSGRP